MRKYSHIFKVLLKNTDNLTISVLRPCGLLPACPGYVLNMAKSNLEKKLRQSEEKYRELYNGAPVMLHSVNADGVII